MREMVLETSSLVLTFDGDTGSLVGLYAKGQDWQVIKRPGLGLSWRMMVPLEGRRNNEAWGHLQKRAPSVRAEVGRIAFTWESIATEHGGELPIRVTALCEVIGDQAVFSLKAENGSPYIVENVYYPYIGDLHRRGDARRLTFQYGDYMGLASFEMFPTFANWAGTHSVPYPTFNLCAQQTPPMQPFGLIQDEGGFGLYVGAVSDRIEACSWFMEALPGWENSNNFRLFEEDEVDGVPVYTRLGVGHMPFVQPGAAFATLPFGLAAYTGGWQEGCACYTGANAAWRRLPERTPAWAKGVHSWLQLHINSPEDELRIPFSQLPAIARQCRERGIGAIQLVGWNHGGQDRGNPDHSPDPRLGTFEELKRAIADIRAMGVKLILFAKFTWADQSRPDYREVYEPLAIKDPYGYPYVHPGYKYMTLTQMADVNTRRFIPMCFGSDAYMDICRREFSKILDLEPDGILYDESQHHGSALCCFDEAHGHGYGAPVFAFDRRLIDMLREMAGEREFFIGGEALYDGQYNTYDLAYGRTWDGRGEHLPLFRLLRPHGQIMTAVIGFDDRSMLNQCLQFRYIISYEPYNFKGKPSDFPRTVDYGQRVDRLRADLSAYFWEGTFVGGRGGRVTLADGRPYTRYSVYVTKEGRRGMVLCNYGLREAITCTPALEEGRFTHMRFVEGEGLSPFDGEITLPPLSAAVLIEA